MKYSLISLHFLFFNRRSTSTVSFFWKARARGGEEREKREGRGGTKDKVEAAAATSAAKAKALDPKITDDGAVVGAETGLVTPGCEPLVLSTRGSTWSVSTRRLQRGHKTTCPRGQAEETSSGSERRTRPDFSRGGGGEQLRASKRARRERGGRERS